MKGSSTAGAGRLPGMIWLVPVAVTAALVFLPVWNPAQRDVAGLFDVFSQFVIALECVRPDGQIAYAGIIR